MLCHRAALQRKDKSLGQAQPARTEGKDPGNAGPGQPRAGNDRPAACGRGRRLPHQHEPFGPGVARSDHRRDTCRRERIRPADRDPVRPAGTQTARRRIYGWPRRDPPRQPFYPRPQSRARRWQPGLPAASRTVRHSPEGPAAADRRRQAAAAGDQRQRGRNPVLGRSRRGYHGPQGRQRARHCHPGVGDDRKGPARPGLRG